jgi:uncharacterized membrane protein YfcA
VDINTGMILAGLAVGLLVGSTGMGAGSLMTPILISVFGIPPTTAVGSDLIYAAITKCFGAARHTQLKNVNRELALWMGAGSVPAAILGVFTLYEIFPRMGIDVNSVLLNAIGIILVVVAIVVAARTFLTIPKLWNAHELPTDGPLDPSHKILAVGIGIVFGFILGLTSVGSGVFFGITLVTLFPLSARKVVGTDLFHAMMVTLAAGLATIAFGTPNYSVVASILIGSIPGILIGSHFTGIAPERMLRGGIALVLGASGLKTLSVAPIWYVIGLAVVLAIAGTYVYTSRRHAAPSADTGEAVEPILQRS